MAVESLICNDCGVAFAMPSHLTKNAMGADVYVVDGAPLWCPACIAKRAKPNPYLDQLAKNRVERALRKKAEGG